jgi:hypothetical protein
LKLLCFKNYFYIILNGQWFYFFVGAISPCYYQCLNFWRFYVFIKLSSN